MALTAKQENFCQNIIDGLTQLESYRRAYDADNMSVQAISNEASKLISSPYISMRINDLRAQLAERLLFPRVERLEVLKGIAKSGRRDGDKINAIKVFSEMLGDNAPKKLSIEHSGETTQKTIKILNAEDLVID